MERRGLNLDGRKGREFFNTKIDNLFTFYQSWAKLL
jgi:hypothetical protein